MNGLSGDAVHLTQAILHAGLEPMRPEVVIFPPFTLLHAVSQEAKSSALRWGGKTFSGKPAAPIPEKYPGPCSVIWGAVMC
ncbi:hypothetical protein AFERRID_05890 [Acidithiobacillus ferridurans]|uniref:Uncharacterized protein n=1 Tax=Acidithiobacillus ferridurans TaxID=1232575 RepID=A0A2Z6IFG5_ACIFI|nr:hypothetical protein [Acidithiobacillus ferridurans]BBF64371.1 hypothetical protein AFERRID_05890 [Acidithiobacillus ferridurans]